jgi:pyridoxamine 5'-phosphate oxidase
MISVKVIVVSLVYTCNCNKVIVKHKCLFFDLSCNITAQIAIKQMMNEQTKLLADLRKDYKLASLTEADINPNPVAQFNAWFSQATESGQLEPSAMHLCTVAASGRPSGRIVLLKGIDEGGFIFYTNYESRKGQELAENPFASITFFWDTLERQVRIEGKIERVDEATSEHYFHSRPYESQIAAIVSPQSKVIESRNALEKPWAELKDQYLDVQKAPKPPYWGGFKVIPDYFEFWQGRRSRMHDRLIYQPADNNNWKIERLAP